MPARRSTRLERGLVEAGALAAQGVADDVGKLFEHGRLLRGKRR